MVSISIDVEKRLLSVAQQVLKKNNLELGTSQDDVDTWDSLGHVRLIMEIEREFGISIPINEFANIRTLRDFLRYVGGN